MRRCGSRDWAGARPWLEERGITPTVTFVMDALGNPTGGMQQGFRQASNLGVDLRFDLQKLFGLESLSPRVDAPPHRFRDLPLEIYDRIAARTRKPIA